MMRFGANVRGGCQQGHSCRWYEHSRRGQEAVASASAGHQQVKGDKAVTFLVTVCNALEPFVKARGTRLA
jgi:hypothetical protein